MVWVLEYHHKLGVDVSVLSTQRVGELAIADVILQHIHDLDNEAAAAGILVALAGGDTDKAWALWNRAQDALTAPEMVKLSEVEVLRTKEGCLERIQRDANKILEDMTGAPTEEETDRDR